MTQTSLDFSSSPPLTDLLAKQSLCARVARMLLSKRGQWVDGRELARVGGYAAYRTRISDLRQAPWWFQIDNRVRTVTEDGRTFKVSEYVLR